MGEELDIGCFFFKNADGKFIKFDGLASAEFVEPEEPEKNDEVYAYIPRNQEFEATIEGRLTKIGYITMQLWFPCKRTIRRVLRWDEKLRRMEIKHGTKINNRLLSAIDFARYAPNNKSFKQQFQTFYILGGVK